MTDAKQIRAARAMTGMSQAQLAEKIGVSTKTIKRAENDEDTTVAQDTISALRKALEDAGIEFLGNGKGPGVRLTK